MLLLAKTVTAVASKAAELSGGKVAAIGFTGFSETGILIDGAGKPLAPGLAWHDPRGLTEPIVKELGDYEFRARAGAFTFSGANAIVCRPPLAELARVAP